MEPAKEKIYHVIIPPADEYENFIAFSQLENSLLRNNPEAQIDIVKKAYDLAKKVHDGQTRDEGTPYFIHPFRVTLYLAEEVAMKNEKILAIALLHDTLEDNEALTKEDLKREFGTDIASCVNILTKPKITPKRTRTMRDIHYHDRLRQAPGNVILVKIADRLDNVRSLNFSPDPRKHRNYAAETRDFFIPLAKKYLPQAADEMEQCLKKMKL